MGEYYEKCVPGEGPRHRVRISKPFYLGRCEVTQSEFEKVVGENPSHYSSAGVAKDRVAGQDTASFPVESVLWSKADEFCRKCSNLPQEKATGRVYRLPTEAEWEYACRTGTTTRYAFGDDWAASGKYEWSGKNSTGAPHPVGTRLSNAWNLCDMHGSVREWCLDHWQINYYEKSPGEDPPGPTPKGGGDSGHTMRGGSWRDDGPDMFRCASRWGLPPEASPVVTGFRIVCEIDEMPGS